MTFLGRAVWATRGRVLSSLSPDTQEPSTADVTDAVPMPLTPLRRLNSDGSMEELAW